jgi:hypothetical protein
MNAAQIDRTNEFTSRLIQQLTAPKKDYGHSADALAKAYAAAFARR